MDIYCCNCGEPYDMYCITDPEEREGMISEGAEIVKNRLVKCPCCPADGELDESQKDRALFSEVAHDLLGDDIDGIAAILDDFYYLNDEE